MRKLPQRGNLTKNMLGLLAAQQRLTDEHATPAVEADRLYRNGRKTVWFSPVVKALKKLSGKAQRCMFCSGSESSDVEHYKPKAIFPSQTFAWENYLWCCPICNRAKGDRFPPDTEPGAMIVHPLADNSPWDFFFIDKFGLLTARFDLATDAPNARAESTIRIVKLNREALQENRRARLRDLKQQVSEAVSRFKKGEIKRSTLQKKVATWSKQPFQPDVADYFLNGPGQNELPFVVLFALIKEENAATGGHQ